MNKIKTGFGFKTIELRTGPISIVVFTCDITIRNTRIPLGDFRINGCECIVETNYTDRKGKFIDNSVRFVYQTQSFEKHERMQVEVMTYCKLHAENKLDDKYAWLPSHEISSTNGVKVIGRIDLAKAQGYVCHIQDVKHHMQQIMDKCKREGACIGEYKHLKIAFDNNSADDMTAVLSNNKTWCVRNKIVKF